MDVTKFPRLYVDQDFQADATLELDAHVAHYLKTVMRRQEGDAVRVFNGRDGEWLATLHQLGKKSAQTTLKEQIKEQPVAQDPITLYFAPIKKARLDFLIEKAVEMGVTDLHPILTANVQNPKLNIDRMHTHITEAAEQCERMEIPTLHPIQKLINFTSDDQLYWCAERFDGAVPLSQFPKARNFLIGPEGGFTEEEKARLKNFETVQPVSLGDTLLRAETAVMMCLSHTRLQNL